MVRRCRYCKALVDMRDWTAHRRRCYDAQSERTAHAGSAQWKRDRKAAKERAHGLCWCGAPATEVHHIDGNWRNNDPSNHLAVCAEHNPRVSLGDNAL